MDRPSKEVIESILEEFKPQGCGCEHKTPRLDAHELATEVRALRLELEAWKEAHTALTRLLGDTQRMLRECERERDQKVGAYLDQQMLLADIRKAREERDAACNKDPYVSTIKAWAESLNAEIHWKLVRVEALRDYWADGHQVTAEELTAALGGGHG